MWKKDGKMITQILKNILSKFFKNGNVLYVFWFLFNHKIIR